MKFIVLVLLGVAVIYCYKLLPVNLRICLAGFNIIPSPGLARSRVFINHWTGEKVTAYRKFTEKDSEEFAKYYPFINQGEKDKEQK